MEITRDEVVHVAKLARLELTEDELERFAEQLNAILEAVGKVSELDLAGVEPTLHPLEQPGRLLGSQPQRVDHATVSQTAPRGPPGPLRTA